MSQEKLVMQILIATPEVMQEPGDATTSPTRPGMVVVSKIGDANPEVMETIFLTSLAAFHCKIFVEIHYEKN